MPLQATSGAASYDAFGGGVPVVPQYIEDVFSCFLYTGTGAAQTITNGIDLSTKGGLVWIKNRVTGGTSNIITDTVRGKDNGLVTNSTGAQNTVASGMGFGVTNCFLTNGFTLRNSSDFTAVGETFASWTFRKQPKFFDVVTYTGTGSNRTISHSLSSVPACIMVKRTDTTADWAVYHRSLANTQYLVLNSTAAAATGATWWNSTTPTSAVFSVGTDASVNASGGTYVAYLFAHDAGGFGLTGTDNVISCGSYTGNGAVGGQLINLGYEAQWVLIKNALTVGADWWILDTMRGWTVNADFGVDRALFANATVKEQGQVSGEPASQGFRPIQDNVNQSGQTYIYIAIRRGPMKVPTVGTKVFAPVAQTGGPSNPIVTGFRVDASIAALTGAVSPRYVGDRLRGSAPILSPNDTTAEYNDYTAYFNFNVSNTGIVDNLVGGNAGVWWNFQRAPSFFDEVCYTGTGSNITLNHNLGVVPELMIFKTRTGAARAWGVYSSAFGVNKKLVLNTTAAVANDSFFVDTTPTATVFYPGNADESNEGGNTYVAYLFATCTGVSKVGSYTGTGALQTVNCGFTSGARFVLIKRTDSTGNWWTYDSARGITSGTDPYLYLNSTAAEVTGTNYVDTDSTGFKVTAAAPAELNASGGTYIFLAIA